MSDTGEIFKNGHKLNQIINQDGYKHVIVKDQFGAYTTLRVGRAVAMAFIENDDPKIKTEVNHKDYNRANDCVWNLEWMSHADNVRYSTPNRKDISGDKNPNYGNRKLSKRYEEHPEDALKYQSRKGLQNGRARGIKAILNGEVVGEFEYIVMCCNYLNSFFGTSRDASSLRSQIDKSVRTGKQYKGFTFEKQ